MITTKDQIQIRLAIVGILLFTLGAAWTSAQTVTTEGSSVEMLESANGIDWYDAGQAGVGGKGWEDTIRLYDRFPAKAENSARGAVWNLSRQSAGMYVEFQTDATSISARWQLTLSQLDQIKMPATGVSGVDLYSKDDAGQWRWVAVGKPDTYPLVEKQLVAGLAPGLHTYRLYLPLYNGVESVAVGVNQGAAFVPVTPETDRPIVFYGSSITQGAAASRPGMSYVAILGRRLGMPTINLGFSGNGRMEPEIAALLAELSPSIYVLDAFPNMNSGMIAANFERFVRTLRDVHPETPIVIVEGRALTNTPFLPDRQHRYKLEDQVTRMIYKRLVDAGVTGLSFVPREGLFGDDGDGSVDGSHPTDLGFDRYSSILEPILRPLLP